MRRTRNKRQPYLCIEFLLFIGLVTIFGFNTYQRNLIWKTDHTLWSDVIRKFPHKDRPHVNLGNSYFEKGFLNRALTEYKRAIEINPMHPYAKTYYNLGVVYERKNIFNKAVDAYQRALSIEPDFLEALDNIGNTYLKMGLIDEAMKKYKMAISIKPDFPEPHWNLGLAYGKKGLLDKAILEFQKYFELRPNNVQAKTKIDDLQFQILTTCNPPKGKD